MVVSKLAARLRSSAGQTMAEYAVVLAVIGVGVLAVFAGFSGAAAAAVTRATALLP
jgi:Flp pilus assembly pilin Flp